MRIVKVLGGLGNQMFQFALYEALRRQHPAERVLLDLRCFNGYHKHRGFELDKVFGVSFEEATWQEVAKLAYPYPNFHCWRFGSRLLPSRKTMLCEQPNFALEPDAVTRKGDTYYDGYWQHEDYFKAIRGELLKIYRFPAFEDERNRKLAQRLSETNSCSLHIRRGDYLTDPLRKGTTGTDYVVRAISRMQEAVKPDGWCLFSDDANWTREQIIPLLPESDITLVDWNNNEQSVNDMHLMSLCRHHIIANSSFSWWGAWLSERQEKCVIAPDFWMTGKDVCSPVAEGWIKI